MATIEDLRRAVTHVVDAIAPTIENAKHRTWAPESDGIYPLVHRAVLIRQYESFQAILDLDRAGKGFAGVTLLRPAVEELIWTKYLSSIARLAADALLHALVVTEVQDSVKAQDDYLGRAATKDLGLLPYLDQSGRIDARVRGDLRRLGRELKWERRTIEAGALPSVAFLAKRTGLKQEYNYLYHATSRFVHFSTAELLRRAWGTRERISITSENFQMFWTSFAIYWGFWVLSQTYLLLTPILAIDGVDEPDIDGESILRAFEQIAEFGQVPIVTAAELKRGFESAV